MENHCAKGNIMIDFIEQIIGQIQQYIADRWDVCAISNIKDILSNAHNTLRPKQYTKVAIFGRQCIKIITEMEKENE